MINCCVVGIKASRLPINYCAVGLKASRLPIDFWAIGIKASHLPVNFCALDLKVSRLPIPCISLAYQLLPACLSAAPGLLINCYALDINVCSFPYQLVKLTYQRMRLASQITRSGYQGQPLIYPPNEVTCPQNGPIVALETFTYASAHPASRETAAHAVTKLSC